MKLGTTSQKILLLLLAGAALGFSHSPSRARRVIKAVSDDWKNIDRRELYRSIRRLYESQLVHYREHQDGSISLVLSDQGHTRALRYKLDEMVVQRPTAWDNKWRVVLFDIPEKKKQLRDALRFRLRQLGFIEFQKSVFVHPFECRDEIDFVVEFYQARPFVRMIEAVSIDNELHLKKKFDLS